MSSGTPGWAFIVTALVAVFGWFFVNNMNTQREIHNWRRSELLKITSKLIELSNVRYELLVNRSREYNDDEHYRDKTKDWDTHADLVVQMQSLVEQLNLLDVGKLKDAYEELANVHARSENEIDIQSYDADRDFWGMPDREKLRTYHTDVADAFKRIINSNLLPGISKSDLI